MSDQNKFPGSTPTTQIAWPTESRARNQIQQTKGSAVPQKQFVLPSTQPSTSAVRPRTTPGHVSNIRVVTRTAGGQKTVTVAFTHPGGDLYFQGAKVYLKRGGKEPVQVASGSASPLTFTVASTPIPHSVHITSFGPWGESDVLSSPSKRVSLK